MQARESPRMAEATFDRAGEQLATPPLRTQSTVASRLRSEAFVDGLVPYVVLIVLVIWLGLLQPASLRINQLHAILNLTMPLILLAIGQTIVVLTGGLDLSVGGVLSLISVITALTMQTSNQVVLMTLLLLALSLIPGLVNGTLIAYGRIQPFVATLATWFILGGLALVILPSPGGMIDASLAFLSNGRLVGIPMSILVFILAILLGVWFQRTRLGLQIQAIGSDREAAFHSGIKVKRVEVAAYVLSSFFAGVAGIFLAAQSLSGDPRVGDAYILTSFASVAIGGARLSGGRASIVGSMVGALALSYLISVTYALRLPSQWALISQALLLILCVFFQHVVHLIFRRRGDL
jgi:ribose transport system permease protein